MNAVSIPGSEELEVLSPSCIEIVQCTKNEIARIMQKVPIKKAPGYDGIDFIVLKTIFRTNPDIPITFYNKCLSLQCFSNPLKTGVTVLFLKKGKNKSDIKSHRPVSLLPTFGKTQPPPQKK
ncbi:hypothetical protein AVEN_116923-1 [Araneus ventricosus]|uniref:Reverse transcriptase domain-containing protein n=1 Tax=Araneus ventricosus TaxID=182803 RepID=A0A4Y2WB78_ARAVE|nr:hypothetical protein AVEN_116923-1 [Araneus ventricosus]